MRERFFLLKLEFDILAVVGKWFVFTLGVSRKFVLRMFYHLKSFSTFLALVDV